MQENEAAADEELRAAQEALARGDASGAAEAYQRAASHYEVPPGTLCAKLARVLADLEDWEHANDWALRVVDSPESPLSAWTAAARVHQRCRAEAELPHKRRLRAALTSTWTTDMFAPTLTLAAARRGVHLDLYEAPFDQYFQESLDPQSALHSADPEVVFLCPDYRALGLPSPDAPPDIARDIDRWCGVWDPLRTKGATVIQQGFVVPSADAFGHLGQTVEGSPRNAVADLNRGMAARAGELGVGFVDVDGLASRYGKGNWLDDLNWHMAKIAFSQDALCVLAEHTVAVLAAKLGLSRRVLVVDLDNTMWGGVVGEEGIDGVRLGNDATGEAFVDFQRAIQQRCERGILLAVCSKNDPDLARDAFSTHPEMVLSIDDVAVFMANWQPKHENIVEISRRLGLGLDSFTFLDDNPYERAQVRHALPEVDVPVLPRDPVNYRRTLEDYPYLEPSALTAEDRQRTEQYRGRAQAEEIRENAGSLREYQEDLRMIATIGPIDDANLPRVVQLINKTNQFNMTTRRRDRAAVEQLINSPDVVHLWVRLRDRFVDHGLIAVVIGVKSGSTLEIDTLLMSCRVIGRGLEEVMFEQLVEAADRLGCDTVRGLYYPTDRNGSVSGLYERLGLARDSAPDESEGATAWRFDVRTGYRAESPIELDYAQAEHQGEPQ